MHTALTRLRALFRPSIPPQVGVCKDEAACSWDTMRATYEEQAARGVPEAIVGLELIEQGRWPVSGRPRDGSGAGDG